MFAFSRVYLGGDIEYKINFFNDIENIEALQTHKKLWWAVIYGEAGASPWAVKVESAMKVCDLPYRYCLTERVQGYAV